MLKRTGRMSILAFLIIISGVYSQGRGRYHNSDRGGKSAFGHSRFVYNIYNLSSKDRNKSKLLVYWSFVHDILQFVKEKENRYCARYEIEIDLFDRKMNHIDGHSAANEIVTSNYEDTNSNILFRTGNAFFVAKPGKYILRIELTDLDTQKSLIRKKEIILRDFSQNKLCLSDVIFVDTAKIDSSGILKIRPNLNANFNNPDANFSAYVEIYPPLRQDSLQFHYSIIDSYDKTTYDTTFTIIAANNTARFNINLKKAITNPGRYFLVVKALAQKKSATLKRRFFVQWGDLPVSLINIDKLLEPLEIIGKAEELKNLDRATPEAKEEAYNAFWKRRDPTPQTEANEVKAEFYRRVDFCNHNFTVYMLDKQGWTTDRGRIFLKYGEPSQVEKQYSDINRPAIEIWYYEKRHQKFIFADRSGMGNYQLVKIE